jgi:uncharacterized membrane protein
MKKKTLDILSKKGLWLVAASLFFLWLFFLKPYAEAVIRIPSPEYEHIRKFYLWIIRLGCGFLLFIGACLWIKKKPSLWVFPAAVVGLGLFYMMVLPPFSVPDEAVHFVSAYRLSSQIMGKPATADKDFYNQATQEEKELIEKGGSVLVRKQDAMDYPYPDVDRNSYDLILKGFFTRDTSEGVTVREEIPVNNMPLVYLPQALGIVLARLLHVGYIPLMYFGRLFNLLAFAGLSLLAVKLMPFKKEVIMAVSCLPMTLHLAASLSYDTMIIGLSMIFLAWVFYLAYEKEKITVKDVILLALILVILEPVKIVYLPMAGICLLIPAAKFPSKKHYWLSVAAVVIVMIAAIYLVNKVVLTAWTTHSDYYLAWDEAAGNTAGYTLQDVFTNPYDTMLVYYETLVTQFDYYQATMLGAFLGNLDPSLTVPYFCLFLLWGVLFIVSVRREGETVPVKKGQKLWILVLIFLSIVLVLTSMFLGWTPRGYTYITGIQGRYFLPLLPFLLILLFDRNLTIGKDFRKGAFYVECFISIYSLIRICSIACIR